MMDRMIIDGLAFALPLFIIAVGGIYSERSGIINLALEGLMGFGAFSGALAVVLVLRSFPGLQPQGIYIAMIFAMVGGALFATIHAALCIYFKANQVISGVVINILSVSLTAFLTRQLNSLIFKAPSDRFQLGVASRITIPGLSEIPVLGAIFRNLYPFQIVIVLVAVAAYVLFEKSRYGMRLRACGDNPHAVAAAGVDVERIRFSAVVISGALAGLGGISFAYSISANFSPMIYMGYGYLAIAALIFGNWGMTTTLGAALLFGFARSGGYELARALEMSSTFNDITMTLPYVLTLILLIFFSKTNRVPRSLGEIYDKGKR
ncbi:ABC transporter permease [Anoxynatronum sibiricum]|uniref:ABC transporter permease n=1 Tax=Anoxynatronum sibiricum TaxID=210623 RepID=A0ABU9VUT2_9CLOT